MRRRASHAEALTPHTNFTLPLSKSNFQSIELPPSEKYIATVLAAL
eukprot:CAMPEP_0180641450 /NCGR_PEP_ID=MMETSP1037_2-20121125/46507_1 /TAXON_ID=632150 /ORGANISM="Azadinium spinosum, Strain 3D9" /LENGTH=45 /DNA_ID= /DNA_START= /DNA_END= /DNA_ORIENTATION=